MTVRGTLKADGMVVARINIDFMANPTKIGVLAGFIHQPTGQTLGWAHGEGGSWSQATLEKLQGLRESMEEDLARVLFMDQPATNKPAIELDGGLGEHLGDAPSI